MCNKSVSFLFSLIQKYKDTFKNGAGDMMNMSRMFVEYCFTNRLSTWISDDYNNNKIYHYDKFYPSTIITYSLLP